MKKMTLAISLTLIFSTGVQADNLEKVSDAFLKLALNPVFQDSTICERWANMAGDKAKEKVFQDMTWKAGAKILNGNVNAYETEAVALIGGVKRAFKAKASGRIHGFALPPQKDQQIAGTLVDQMCDIEKMNNRISAMPSKKFDHKNTFPKVFPSPNKLLEVTNMIQDLPALSSALRCSEISSKLGYPIDGYQNDAVNVLDSLSVLRPLSDEEFRLVSFSAMMVNTRYVNAVADSSRYARGVSEQEVWSNMHTQSCIGAAYKGGVENIPLGM